MVKVTLFFKNMFLLILNLYVINGCRIWHKREVCIRSTRAHPGSNRKLYWSYFFIEKAIVACDLLRHICLTMHNNYALYILTTIQHSDIWRTDMCIVLKSQRMNMYIEGLVQVADYQTPTNIFSVSLPNLALSPIR